MNVYEIGSMAEKLANNTYPGRGIVLGMTPDGKTAVAACAMFSCAKSGMQAAFMAPTEILAEQHFVTLSAFFEESGVKCGLLTGSLTAKQKREIKEDLSQGRIDIIVGTHALLTDNVEFKNKERIEK